MRQYLRQSLPLIALLTFFAIATSLVALANDIRIGVVQDQSGLNSDISRDYLAGARTYFDHINAQGGIKGRKFFLVVKDDAGDPNQTVTATHELLSKERVDVLFGFTGDDATAAVIGDRALQHGVVVRGVGLVAGSRRIQLAPSNSQVSSRKSGEPTLPPNSTVRSRWTSYAIAAP